MTTFSNVSMTSYKLRKNLGTTHKDKKDKSLDYLKKLLDNFKTRPTAKKILNERALQASYEISKLIAKLASHTILRNR
jgi:molybdopterin biosynthesis enzyme MoaB